MLHLFSLLFPPPPLLFNIWTIYMRQPKLNCSKSNCLSIVNKESPSPNNIALKIRLLWYSQLISKLFFCGLWATYWGLSHYSSIILSTLPFVHCCLALLTSLLFLRRGQLLPTLGFSLMTFPSAFLFPQVSGSFLLFRITLNIREFTPLPFL